MPGYLQNIVSWKNMYISNAIFRNELMKLKKWFKVIKNIYRFSNFQGKLSNFTQEYLFWEE